MKKLLLCFIVLFPLVLGCAAAVPLAGVSGGAVNLAIFWCNNEGRKYYEYDAETIHRAAKQALEKMGQPITSDTTKEIKAGAKDRLKIKIEERQPRITKLSCRVNTLGDKEMGELFFRYVDDQLNVVQFDSPAKNIPAQPKAPRKRSLFFTR